MIHTPRVQGCLTLLMKGEPLLGQVRLLGMRPSADTAR